MPARKDFYISLNEDSKLKIEIDIPALVKSINALNYGTHRFLSALVDELREKQTEYIEKWKKQYPQLVNERERSELADGIEALLNQGFYK